MTIINQTNRTLLLEEINPEKLDLLTLIGDVKGIASISDDMVTAFTHTNQEVTLIHSLDRENTSGFISRNMADLTLKLYLKDLEGRQRYIYNCSCDPDKFSNQKAEEIVARYSGQIRQDDLDDIVDRELKFFILADENRWGFTVVPVLRREGQLQLGPDQFFRFETEGWVTNFFDGTR